MKLAMVFLTNGFLSGGAIKHVRLITPRLLADTQISELRLYVPEGSVSDLPADWPLTTFDAQRRKGMAALRRQLAEFRPDVIFVPSARYVSVPGAKTTVMVRNMEPLEVPFADNAAIDKLKNLGRRLAARRACRSADRIIAVSDHVKEWLEANWSIPEEKIGVVRHGVDALSEAERPATLAALGNQPFIFAAGSIRAARGLTDLVGALALADVPGDLQLVFAGTVTPGAERHHRKLLSQIEKLGIGGRVHWAGALSSAEMTWCFRQSRLFVMTSRAEACPNTVLEALACGCLSVSGDNPPMPEFFQDSASYYRNGDPASLARAIGRALALSEAEQRRLRARALARAAEFSWQETADRTLQELRLALSASPPSRQS